MSSCPQTNDTCIPIFEFGEDATTCNQLDTIFGFSDYLEDSPFAGLNDAHNGAHDENNEFSNLELWPEFSDNNLCTFSPLSLQNADSARDACSPRSSLACSSGSLENELLLFSVETFESTKIPDTQNYGSFLIGSSASVDSFLCTFGSTCDVEDEDKAVDCSSQKHGIIPMRNHIVPCSIWCRGNDDDESLAVDASTPRVTSEPKQTLTQIDADITLEKQSKQSSKWDGDESLNSKASKRHIRSKSKHTRTQIDTDIVPAKRSKKSSKRDGDKRVTSKASKRRARSKPKKSLAQAAKQPKKTSKRSIRRWTKEEDAKLEEGVKLFKIPHWSLIAKHVETRTNKMCAQRWRYTLRPEMKLSKKGAWSKGEDQKLLGVASKHKIKNERTWDMISESMGFTRSNIQCRERWINFLDPTLNSGPWTNEEDVRLMSLYKERGNCWKKLTLEFVGRSAMHIRRRFNHLKTGGNGCQRSKSAYLK